MKTTPAEPAGTTKPDAPRTPDGRFSSLGDADGGGVLPTPMTMEDDPFLSALDPEVAAGAGIKVASGAPADAPADEPAADEPDGGEDGVDPLLRELATGAGDQGEDDDDGAGEPPAPPAPAPTEPDDGAVIARLARLDPELAKRYVDVLAGKTATSATPPAAPPADELEALRSEWNAAIKAGGDFDAVVKIARKAAALEHAKAAAPLIAKHKAEEAARENIRSTVKAFRAFEKANPGWEVHRKGMQAELRAIARDFGPDVATKISPEKLLHRVAPDFKPLDAARAAAAAGRRQPAPAPAPTSGRTSSAPAGGAAGGKKSAEQELVDKTVAAMQYDRRVKNLW